MFLTNPPSGDHEIIKYQFYLGSSWEECGVSRAYGFLAALGFTDVNEVSSFLSVHNVFEIFSREGWGQNYLSISEKQLVAKGRSQNSPQTNVLTNSGSLTPPIYNLGVAYEDFFQFIFTWLTGGSTPTDRRKFIEYWESSVKSPQNPFAPKSDTAPCLKTFLNLVKAYLSNPKNRTQPLAENHSRNLTLGEIFLAREIFKNSIDYNTVKVHNGQYILVQQKNTGLTPNGEIYMYDGAYKDDYSVQGIDETKAFFLHEMTHVCNTKGTS